ncbi:MAG: C39 family peptidase [Chloroflexi bacterium]|nr:C39 family peptidase [Chloroflexota bacterium]
MKKPVRKSRWLACSFWLLCIGIVGNLAAFESLTRGQGFLEYPSKKQATATIARIDKIAHESNTATPFQPLPTSTPTPTPTSTSTPTPFPTSTPLPTDTPFPTNTPLPTATVAPLFQNPTNNDLPARASVSGLIGQAQHHSLSCESRSAVDWAAYFGTTLSEEDFQASLPLSDNPEKGFVGTVDDAKGRLPPASYGVHAEPVAATLREFGVSASAGKSISFDEIRQQIANGYPVIVWVIGNVWPGTPYQYTSSDGETTTVSHYEHTVILSGYDEGGVTIVDGNMVYWRSTSAFKSSFSVLGNMGIFKP